ncbi:ABC transporter permease [Candidatus Methanoperedens nitratireducens]|uniref:Putative ABC-2 type transport system permease protein n=1 Tax=Candidatus Methanoperedens nitratireducens TaxID=1392998 RepID=A0A284VKB5_9EURY|nr:ABC transporter permease subunit [Candidatus Methanoperedens nitroreducens]SNQ59637.1 putative ABC-2 type transport system permease protein [Candidatus Methanoperedens nitroreducens]
MKRNIENVFVIAQKEFADSLWSPRFLLILGIFMTILLVNGYQAGQNMSRMGGEFIGVFSPLINSFIGLASLITGVGGLVAVGLGFDAIVKERKSGSLNVLLTHPVYRDQVITGKLIGMMVTLGLGIVISIVASTGIMVGVSGITVSTEVIGRIIVFVVLAFLFMLSYLALSVAISTFTKESSSSLMYSIAVWLALVLLLSMIASAAAGIITEQSISEDASENQVKITRAIMYISPAVHFEELITGPPVGGLMGGKSSSSEMHGLFDTGFSLGYWVEQNWDNLLVLIVFPVILLLISYMAFMRQDITM